MKLQKIFFFLLTTFAVFSQKKTTFSLDWSQNFEASIDKNIWVAQHVYHQNGYVPVYLNQWKKETSKTLGEANFLNIITKKIDISQLGALDIDLIPNDFNPSFRVVKERKAEYYSVEGNVMYKNPQGEVLQVQSFDLIYSLNDRAKFSSIEKSKTIINSVLGSGTWYKIAVDKSGVFKMDAAFLNSIGINTSGINPKHIKVYGNGGAMLPELLGQARKNDLVENAVYVSGENDNVFNSNDYVLFYAQGPISWDLKSREEITHQQNVYSDKAYYFINVDSGSNGKRILNEALVVASATENITTFTDYQVHEIDAYNYIRVGRKWFGENFSVDSEQSFEFNFPNIVVSTPVLVNGVFSAGSSSRSSAYSVFYKDNLFLGANIERAGNFAFRDVYAAGNFIPENENLVLDVTWSHNGDLSADAYLDYLEVIADRLLIANGQQFKFANFSSADTGKVLEYDLSNSSQIDFIWNVTDINNPQSVLNTATGSGQFKFKELTDGNINQYQLVNVSDAYTPTKLSNSANVENQNLHALQDVQYVIVTTKDLLQQANRIADYHRNNTNVSEIVNQKLNVQVVDVEQIYNEFGSGSPDITAIRDFAKHLYDHGSSDDTRLQYLCLFGDASFDFKQIVYADTQIVPTYQSTISNSLARSYNSDDYYAYLDDTDDVVDNGELSISGKLDIVTGRIPVSSVEKANQYVNKLLNYYSPKSFGSWKNKITLLGDDGQEGGDQNLIRYLEDSALKIATNNADLNIEKLYTDAFNEEITAGGGKYPVITQKFHDAFNNGSLVINYFGHGNVFALGQEGYLNISVIKNFRNFNTLPLFITVTCDFSRFDDPTIVSGGEELIEGAFGGAISMITTAREITIGAGRVVNNSLADYLYGFDGKQRTAAEALKDAKNQFGFFNEFFIYFFGDPAMHLSLPKGDISITNVQKYVTDPVTETTSLQATTDLNGLSKIKVSGNVLTNGVVDENFNGTLFVTLFDKEIERKTLLNESKSVGRTFDANAVVEFTSLESKVFVGEASVKSGRFSFDFVLSKDVSVSPQNAKFSFYAASEDEEKIGSDFNYKVGGIDTNAPNDDVPPTIQLFMDDETFLDGDNTSPTPKLLAKISDASGINTSLNSIGHNITLVIDGDLANPITLNEFYTTEKDDFTQGIVRYQLPELSLGNHTIAFKAWDTYNNATTQTLNFYVQEDKSFKISKVLNYPNPLINHTEFWFKNNRQGNPLEIMVQIYTLSGKLIKTIRNQESNTEDKILRTTVWDGSDDFGNKLGKGVYIYKLTVKEKVSGESDEKIEKLVIL